MVKWISQQPPKLRVQVRFLTGAKLLLLLALALLAAVKARANNVDAAEGATDIAPAQIVVTTAATNVKTAIKKGGYTIIPLPAFTYNRNEGAWYGALMPIFRTSQKGEVEDIWAPLYLHNEFIGEEFTLNYFGYRDNGTKQYHAIISRATKIEGTVDLAYSDITAGESGRYLVDLEANSGKSAFNRFFGFGNQSSNANESDYTMADANLVAMGGIHVTDAASVSVRERYRAVNIQNGASPTLPQTLQAYPDIPGINGADIFGSGVIMAYDTRDSPLTPLAGVYDTALAEWDQNYRFGNPADWWRFTVESRNYIPNADGRGVLVLHGLMDGIAGPDSASAENAPDGAVPFYERPTLGGEDTLRGFGRGRFVSDFALLGNVEERWRVMRKDLMGNDVEVEVAPFLDAGRVGRSFTSQHIVDNMQLNPGFGIRALARPNVAARFDMGWGKDGSNVFVGLDYPF